MTKIIIKIAIAVLCVGAITATAVTVPIVKTNSEMQANRENFAVNKIDKGDNMDAIHFMSTGSSDAILLESDGRFALVDCAEDTDNPRGFEDLELDGFEDRVLDYLKSTVADANGNIVLDFVVGTHAHSDHIGGFDTIISHPQVFVKKAYLKVYDESKISDYEVENWDNQEVYDQMINALNSKNIPIVSDIDGTPFTFGNFTLTFFNTEDNDTEKVGENDRSLGLLVEKNGARVFLAGDIENESGDEDILAPQIGKVDLLKVGHHSYSSATSKGWVQTLMPSVCVVTNAEEKVDKRILRRITRIANCPILITGAENGVIAQIHDDGTITYHNDIH